LEDIWRNGLVLDVFLFGLISGISMNSTHLLSPAVASSDYDNILYRYINMLNFQIKELLEIKDRWALARYLNNNKNELISKQIILKRI